MRGERVAVPEHTPTHTKTFQKNLKEKKKRKEESKLTIALLDSGHTKIWQQAQQQHPNQNKASRSKSESTKTLSPNVIIVQTPKQQTLQQVPANSLASLLHTHASLP